MKNSIGKSIFGEVYPPCCSQTEVQKYLMMHKRLKESKPLSRFYYRQMILKARRPLKEYLVILATFFMT